LILEPWVGKEGYSLTQVDQRFLLQALARGDADALFIQDIFAWQAVNSGKGRFLSVVPLEEYVAKPFFNGGGVIQSKTGSSDPDLARSIREVLDDSVRFIREREPEARESLVRHLGVSQETAQHAAIDRFVTVEEIDWPGAQKVADLMREHGVLDRPVKAKGMLP
jgi:ABC-type nitrate/sulfonate/bicarbonate transport system substrate-binding protein